MTDYNFDRTLKLPSADFMSEAHIAFTQACCDTVDRFSFIKNSIECEFPSDDEVRIYGNAAHAENVSNIISKMAHEFFNLGYSPTNRRVPEEVMRLKNAWDLACPSPRSGPSPEKQAQSKVVLTISAPVSRPQSEIVLPVSLHDLSNAQQMSWAKLKAFLQDNGVSVAEKAGKPSKIRVSCNEKPLMDAASDLVEWAGMKIKDHKSLSDGGLANQLKLIKAAQTMPDREMKNALG